MTQFQSAVVISQPGVVSLVHDRPIPTLRDDYILVKTVAVALNPTDWKHIDFIVKEAGPLVGCDYAGIVEAVGPKVTKSFKKGDRVCGMAHGGNAVQHEDGTFAEYITVKGDVQIKFPQNLSFEEASTLGVGITTVGQGLYQALQLAPVTSPITTAEPILIYGGSTATGGLAIQYAKLSGYTVLTTCSAHNFALVKSLGADAVFDYNDSQCAEDIRKFTDGKLALAFDTVSTPPTAKLCADVLTTAGGAKYGSLGWVEIGRQDVETFFTLAYTSFGESYTFIDGKEVPANYSDFEFAKSFWELSRGLLEAGKLKVHRPRTGKGWQSVLDGLQLLKQGKVSGEKLVYVVSNS
jgi:NADPH:quinone reductase-like Zn-dependent oxidoreductase